MQFRLPLAAVAIALNLLGWPEALAQNGGGWVDPPEDLGGPSAPDATSSTSPPAVDSTPLAPAPPPQSGRIPPPSSDTGARKPAMAPAPTGPAGGMSGVATLAETARALAFDYLETWSAPAPMTPDSIGRFYAATVRFHGRVLSAAALAREKRRFVQRWPERRYEHRPDSVEASCDAAAETCVVRSVFDFTASNPRTRRHSQGAATLELTISFKGGRPVIIAENSKVVGRDTRGPVTVGRRSDE